MEEILVKSSIDETLQPSLFYFAGENKPLLVGLHTWSCDRFNQKDNMLPLAEKYGWNLLLPEFRGPNKEKNPNHLDACGSVKARQDVVDAINYVEEKFNTDRNNRYIIGGSGGGHMALMMAGYKPEMFKCVISYVPITSVSDWYYEKLEDTSNLKGYADDIYCCLGKKTPEEAQTEYLERSPVNYIDNIAKTTVRICHGKFDPSVPFTHSLKLYNAICAKYPKANTFFEVFNGGHEIHIEESFKWINDYVNKINTATKVTG